MDFSSLDLLASTALRDNNPSQADGSAPSHTHIAHHDGVDGDEGDDDETDGEKDAVSAVETGTLANHQGHNMGSVKIGKNKKGTSSASKPVLKSIFVCDGKYVTKKVSPTDKIVTKEKSGSREGAGRTVVTEVRAKEKLCLCTNNNAVSDTPLCDLHSEEKVSASQLSSEDRAGLCNGSLNTKPEVLGHSITANSDCVEEPEHMDLEDPVTDSVLSNSNVTEAGGTSFTQTAPDTLPDTKVTQTSHKIHLEKSGETIETPHVTSKLSSSQVSTAACDSLKAAGTCGLSANVSSSQSQVSSVTGERESQTSQSQTRTVCDSRDHSDEDKACGSSSEPPAQAVELRTGSNEHGQDTMGVHSSPCSEVVPDGGASSALSFTNSSSHPPPTHTAASGGGEAESHLPSVNKDTVTVAEISAEASPCEEESGAASETIGCNNCDEKRAVQPASPHPLPPSSSSCLPLSSVSPVLPSSSSPLHPSSSKTVTGEENNSSRDNLDQDVGSSGNNDISASTSCLYTMLSPPHPSPPTVASADTVSLDHCYFCSSDKLALGQSVENTDDSGDAFESADENVSADDIERRPRSLSVDSEYLQYGVPATANQNDKTSLLSPTLSVDSVSNDSSMSEHSSAAGGHFYSILSGGQPQARAPPQQKLPVADGVDSQAANAEVSRLNASLLDGAAGGPKCGRFRIGTFGSFSNSHLDLEGGEGKKLKIGIPPDTGMKSSISSPALVSPVSPFPSLQSPGMEWDRSDAGSEAPDDLDSSTTEDKFLSSSHDSETYLSAAGQVWNHPVFHDHDYCCKEVSEKLGKPITLVKSGKRKNARKKESRECEEEKLKKGKYLKMELLKQDNRFSLANGGSASGSGGLDGRSLASRSSLLAESLISKPNPVGRPRKRFEKPVEEYDAETGTKMKITGKYQDQYVYYYSKTSRNRRRKPDEKTRHGENIILPPSKPGDIVVPHLTDADCEAIKRGGRSAFKGASGSGFSASHLPNADHCELMDSSIVNTILSMESDNLATSPMGSQDGDGDLQGIAENLTTEQVDLLLDCLKDVEVATTSQALDNILTSAEPVPMVSNYLDSLASTTVEDDFLVPNLPLPTTTTCLPSTSGSEAAPKTVSAVSEMKIKTEPGCVDFIKQEEVEGGVPSAMSNGLPGGTPTSCPSVEKNLEFLKNPDIKSEFYPVTSSAGSSSNFAPVSQSPHVEVETPWIVTVTLYWNDIPAIIINNVPFVRLVDIHRQILPAKDTGILKKRCQLMNIHVSNCSEMQRYFLVQYGRAHNSKSTLVINKDEAWRLISYYANPQPRNLRGEEAGVMRRSSSYAELRSTYLPSGVGRGQQPSPASAFAHPRKRGGFRRRNTATRSRNPSPDQVVAAVTPEGLEKPPPSPLPAEPASPSKGLRHKKINFLEMLKGEDSPSQASSPVVEGGVADDDSSQERPSTKAAKGHKRRGSKELGEVSPSKRSRNSRLSSDEAKKVSPAVVSDEQPSEQEITVDSDSASSSGENAKNKKRSPGSSAAAALLGTGSRSPKAKLGPIKVNVKSLVHASQSSAQPRKKNLFGRKSSGTVSPAVDGADGLPASHPLRVLRISHQDAEAVSPLQASSPAAEVHLDMYKRASSPCVRCSTCNQFLSVPAFLKHHHTSDSFQGLINARRMLVPMNKENISVEEQRLWNEFVGLQARLDHSVSSASMGAYPLSPVCALPPSPLVVNRGGLPTSTSLQAHKHNGLDEAPTGSDSETAAMLSDDGTDSYMDASSVGEDTPPADSPWEPQISVCSPPPLNPLPSTHTEIEEKLADSVAKDACKKIHPTPQKTVPVKKQPVPRPRREAPPANVRTSSRPRKRKQFYGFENYDFAAGGKKGGRGDRDAQDSVVDVTGTMSDDQVGVNGFGAASGPLSIPMHVSEND